MAFARDPRSARDFDARLCVREERAGDRIGDRYDDYYDQYYGGDRRRSGRGSHDRGDRMEGSAFQP